jgi:hypothetical protein
MIVYAALAVLMTAAPQDRPVETIRLRPGEAGPRANFHDNRMRTWAIEARREQIDRLIEVNGVRRDRVAEALDGMIARGDCDLARSTARRAGYGDISREVDRVCDAREDG